MNYSQLINWINLRIDEVTDPEIPEDMMNAKNLRVYAISLLQLGRELGAITENEFVSGTDEIVQRLDSIESNQTKIGSTENGFHINPNLGLQGKVK